jgi:hypothetical protein
LEQDERHQTSEQSSNSSELHNGYKMEKREQAMTLSLRDVVRKRYGITGQFSFINDVLSRAKHDVSESVYRTANGVSLQRLLAALDNPPLPPCTSTKPSISVSTEGSGATSVFVVTGSGFLPNTTVHLRFVDDASNMQSFQQSSNEKCQFTLRQGIPCTTGGGLHFSANDGRVVSGSLVWSNTFTTSCP